MGSFRHTFQSRLSLSSKIFLRRLYAGFTRPITNLVEHLRNSKPLAKAPTPPSWKTRNPSALAATVLRKRKLVNQDVNRIRSSIIIPVFNKVDFTFECLQSLLLEIDLLSTEVIVVNNGSTDETSEMLAQFKECIRVIENATNEGFVDACNRGAAMAVGEYLVFLNNDTSVLPGWLENLVDSAENNPAVGAVGSMLLYPDQTIQEAGAIVWKTGEAFHYGWRKSPDDHRYNFAREVDYCSAASLLVRKNLFDRLGGFDRRYAPAYYEDVDLCFAVRSLGYKVIYQPASRVIHYEGVTAGRDTAIGTKHYQIINQKKLYEKWRNVLERDHFERDLKRPDRAANRKPGPQFLVFDDRVPTPDRDAGSARMFQILKSLQRLGRTVFLPLKPLPQYEQLLWKEGIETANIADYTHLIRKRTFAAALISRPEVADALLQSIRRADRKIKIIFDMVDAYFIRLGRQHQLTGDENLGRETRRYEKLELELAKAADQVWCNSSADKEVVSTYVPAERIVVIPTIHELQGRGKPFDERADLLFIGHLSHSPNSDAVHYFVSEIFPLIKNALPSVLLHIVGSNPSAEIKAYDSENVKILGYVPDIKPLLQTARVFVAPLRFGAGVKGKIGESLSFGLPVVTTSIGAEGFGLTSRKNVMIADTPIEFAAHVRRLYQDAALWQLLADQGYRHIQQHFTPQIIGHTIETGLRNLGVDTFENRTS